MRATRTLQPTTNCVLRTHHLLRPGRRSRERCPRMPCAGVASVPWTWRTTFAPVHQQHPRHGRVRIGHAPVWLPASFRSANGDWLGIRDGLPPLRPWLREVFGGPVRTQRGLDGTGTRLLDRVPCGIPAPACRLHAVRARRDADGGWVGLHAHNQPRVRNRPPDLTEQPPRPPWPRHRQPRRAHRPNDSLPATSYRPGGAALLRWINGPPARRCPDQPRDPSEQPAQALEPPRARRLLTPTVNPTPRHPRLLPTHRWRLRSTATHPAPRPTLRPLRRFR